MFTGLALLCAVAAAPDASGEDDVTRKARQDVEQELAKILKPGSSKLELVYQTPDGLGFRLLEAEFTLDGKKLPSPAAGELAKIGAHPVFAGPLEPGPHELLTKVVFAESAVIFSYVEGYRWKVGAKMSFVAPANLALRVTASPRVVDDAKEAKHRLKVVHDLTAKALPAPPEPAPVEVAAVDAGPGEPAKVAESELEPELAALPKKTTLEVTVTAKKRPVVADVRLFGEDAPRTQTSKRGGPLVLSVAAGRHTIEVAAKRMLAQTRTIEAKEGEKLALSFQLQPAPKKPAVRVKGKRLELSKALSFKKGATLAPQSSALIAQVVDAVVRAGVKKLVVRAHTDNRGKPDALQKLSEEQAAAVARALEAAGLERSRIEAKGFGASLPKVPNLTPKARAKNRRVEFLVDD